MILFAVFWLFGWKEERAACVHFFVDRQVIPIMFLFTEARLFIAVARRVIG